MSAEGKAHVACVLAALKGKASRRVLPQCPRRAASMRSTSFSMIGLDDSGIMRIGAQNTIVSPNTVGRRSDKVTCGGLM
jgi:hypothetical protein